MYFLFLTIMNHKYIIISSKRDTQKQGAENDNISKLQETTLLSGAD